MLLRSDRIYIRIDPKLKRKIQKYCEKNRTSMSDVVNRFFIRLLDETQRREKAEEPKQA